MGFLSRFLMYRIETKQGWGMRYFYQSKEIENEETLAPLGTGSKDYYFFPTLTLSFLTDLFLHFVVSGFALKKYFPPIKVRQQAQRKI